MSEPFDLLQEARSIAGLAVIPLDAWMKIAEAVTKLDDVILILEGSLRGMESAGVDDNIKSHLRLAIDAAKGTGP